MGAFSDILFCIFFWIFSPKCKRLSLFGVLIFINAVFDVGNINTDSLQYCNIF